MYKVILIGALLLLGITCFYVSVLARHKAVKRRWAEEDRFRRKLDEKHPRWIDRASGDVWVLKDIVDERVLLYKEDSPSETLFLHPRTMDEWFEPEEKDNDDRQG
jgi:hypothetical protein